jgi:hypothetical protein
MASEEVTVCVGMVSPTISTLVSPSWITLGSSASDTATLASGYNPTGSITFTIYSNSACSVLVDTLGPVSVSGNGNYGSGSFTPSAAGTYYWIASYSGDSNNNPESTTCGAETLVVGTIASPTISTRLGWQSALTGQSNYDTATLSGETSTAGGTVTYYYFSNGACTAPGTLVSTVTVKNGIVPNSASVTFNTAGSFSWDAVYSGDTNNKGATSACEPFTVYAPQTLSFSSSGPSTLTQGQTGSYAASYTIGAHVALTNVKVQGGITSKATSITIKCDGVTVWSGTTWPSASTTVSACGGTNNLNIGAISSATYDTLTLTFTSITAAKSHILAVTFKFTSSSSGSFDLTGPWSATCTSTAGTTTTPATNQLAVTVT